MQIFTDFTHYTISHIILYVLKHGFHNNLVSKEMHVIHAVIMKVLGKETMESGVKRRIRSGRTSMTARTTRCVSSLEQWYCGAKTRLSEVNKTFL